MSGCLTRDARPAAEPPHDAPELEARRWGSTTAPNTSQFATRSSLRALEHEDALRGHAFDERALQTPRCGSRRSMWGDRRSYRAVPSWRRAVEPPRKQPRRLRLRCLLCPARADRVAARRGRARVGCSRRDGSNETLLGGDGGLRSPARRPFRWRIPQSGTSQLDRTHQPLLDACFEAIGRSPRAPIFAQAHRWQYALADNPLEAGCLFDASTGLAVCGDWTNGNRIEGALLSGLAAAQQIDRMHSRPRTV